MLVMLHAFSRKNSGDGLLVDLALDALAEAGVERRQVRVVALDAGSFGDLAQVTQAPGEPRARPSRRLVHAGSEVLRSAAFELGAPGGGGAVQELLADATGVVAVGGGYLIADSLVRSGGVLVNHLPQVLAAGRTHVPSVYLPQSIGPLRGPVGRLTRRALSRIDVIYARDDDTQRELSGLTDVRRCPDLAVLRLADTLESVPRPSGDGRGPTLLIARALPRAPGYAERLRALGEAVPRPLWGVQADVDGPRSDRRFYRRLGLPDAGDVGDVLREQRPGVVISVRLHGAIASLLAGWPAIHLSYERKGWGAYEDLGIAEWVHDARRFDVDKVVEQAARLHDDPSPLFARLEARMPLLQQASRSLVEELRSRFVNGVTPSPRAARTESGGVAPR